MAVVAVRERPSATVGTHVRDPIPTIDSADPDMTREVRLARAAWRREHLEEWRRELEALYHFDPEFIYDPAHEYDRESTTDPDYGAEGVHFLEYDEDGVVSPLEKRAREVQKHGADAASDTLADTGLEGDYEREVRFRPEIVARVNQAADESHPVQKGVRPDMLVRAVMSAAERERFMPEGILRLDLGAPVPPLVLEVVSKSWAHRDLNYKKRLYAAAGISEYLVYDLGGKRRAGSPRELLMFRLEGGSYRQDPVADAYWSAVFNTRVRIMPDAREREEELRGVPEEDRLPPRFQWWDGKQGRWRDRETDRKHEQERTGREREARGEARGEAKMAIAALYRFLSELSRQSLDQIAVHWREHGPPDNVMDRILEVRENPGVWRSLLLDDADFDNDATQASDHDADRSPPGTL
ncbi:MAG: Uma2 family endonuclease [Caldilineaceae bacterium]|nr:Uma2 family endonuclease [Caldilineaceae bacterium]